MNKKDLISIRLGNAFDEPFIYSTWLQGLRYSEEPTHPKKISESAKKRGFTLDETIPFTSGYKMAEDFYRFNFFSCIDQDIYFKAYHYVIERILKRPTTEISVACLKEDHDVILGYAILEPTILHWVFVKPAWRDIGIAKDLIPKDTRTVTHLTRVGLKIKPQNVIFDPFQ